MTQLPGGDALPAVHINGGTRVRLANNIIHDSYTNAALRLSDAHSDVIVERNAFYNGGSAQLAHIANGARAIFRDNILFSDYEATGNVPDGGGSFHFVWIEDADGSGALDHDVERNIFMRWDDEIGSGFIGVTGGERVAVESNLFLGDSATEMTAALVIQTGTAVRYVNNTVVGDLPSRAFAVATTDQTARLALANNIWSDPSETMDDFSDGDAVLEATLSSNLYWNGGAIIPAEDGDPLLPASDTSAIVADPELPAVAIAPGPVWQRGDAQFVGGFATVCEVFEANAARGQITTNSPAYQQADAELLPELDLLGKSRTTASRGALEP